MKSILLLAVGVAMAMEARPAEACDCASGPPSQSEIATSAGAIFVGRPLVKTQSSDPANWDVEYEVEVLRAWKGVSAGDRVVIGTDSSDCAIGLPLGAPVLLYVTGTQRDGRQRFFLDHCGENRVVTGGAIAADERLLGAPGSEVAPDHMATCPSSPTQLSPSTALAASRAAVFGKVARVRENKAASLTSYEIRSIRMVKGRRGRATRLILSTPSTGCGVALAKGESVLVFFEDNPGRYWPDLLKGYASRCDALPLLSGTAASSALKTLRPVRATANRRR